MMLMETFLCLARKVLLLAPSRLETVGCRGAAKSTTPGWGDLRESTETLVLWYSEVMGWGSIGHREPFAMEWVKFGVGLEHLGHGRWDKQAAAVLLVPLSPETCPVISQS